MIDFKLLEWEDKETISEFFHQGQYQNSECTFTNLYMWRKSYGVKWAVVNGLLVISPAMGDECWALPPFGRGTAEQLRGTIEQLVACSREHCRRLTLRAVTDPIREQLDAACPGWFCYTEERDIADYLYLAEDLRELKGRKYHGKKNHLNAFFKEYPDHQYEPLTAEIIPEVRAYLEEWCRQKECLDGGKLNHELVCERHAINEALDRFGQLPYQGAVIRINGRVKAFTMGEMVNDETVVVHVEKADHTVRGLYTAINKLFLTNAFPDAIYVNREEDTGDEGLRKAKLSYHPLRLVTKYKGVLCHE